VTVDEGYTLTFVGLKNYIYAFTGDEKFLQYFATTIGDLLYEVPIILVYSFLVAILLKNNFPGVTVYKFIFFLPVILSSDLFFGLLNNFGSTTTSSLDAVMNNAASSGLLQSLNLTKYLTKLGLSAEFVDAMTGPVNKVYEIVTCSGIQIFIFLAALYSVPPDLYESSRLEGANAWEQFWMITIPMVMPMILVKVIYSIVDTFISESNQVMEYVYELSFRNFNFGLSSAMCWIYFAVVAAILAIVFAVINKRTFYYT
jgi:ABC-type sugar transport system permease subunit